MLSEEELREIADMLVSVKYRGWPPDETIQQIYIPAAELERAQERAYRELKRLVKKNPNMRRFVLPIVEGRKIVCRVIVGLEADIAQLRMEMTGREKPGGA